MEVCSYPFTKLYRDLTDILARQRTHHNPNSSLNSLKKSMRTIFSNFSFFISGDSNSR